MKNKEFIISDDLIATKGQRFLNFFLDLIFLYIIILSAGTTIILIGEAANNFSISNWVESMRWQEVIFYSSLIMFLYYCLTEMYFSRTLAKLVTRTVVVRKDGSKPDNKMFVIRSLCRFIPFEGFSFLGATSRGLHDTFSGTYVVKKKKLAKKVKLFYSPDEFGKIEA